MDDLIGGLLALMAAVVVVSVVIAAALCAFAAGALGGAVIGLGQGSVAFASDLGGAITTRGRSRRQPRPPEPAFQLYALGQLKDDLAAALERGWKEMLGFRAACLKFAERYSNGWTAPLAWGVVAGGYLAPLLGAALGLIIAAPILIVAGLLIAGAWLLVWALRGVEAIRRRVRRTAYECPQDHERFPLPVYVCPSCGSEHHELVPGRWGIFRRECSCQSASLPTTVIGGRQRVPQRCPSGHPMSGLIGFAETLRVALVAGPGAGKTTYLAAAMLELEAISAEKRLAVSVLAESTGTYRDVVDRLRHGRLPDKTQISGNPALVAEVQGNDRSRVLYAYDVAGESYQSSDQVRQLRFLEVPSGLVLLVDPFSLRRVAEEHAEELDRARDAIGPSAEDPIRVLERTVAALVESGASPKDVPVAVVVGKADAFGIGAEIEALRASAGEDAPRHWLESKGAGNFTRAVEQEFKHVRWFSCSALGRVPDASNQTPFEPEGAIAPLLWLLSRRGVVPAARPFEASHTAERLAGADASSFAPIGSGGWAWRVTAATLAIVLLLAAVLIGVGQLVSSSSESNAVAAGGAAPAALAPTSEPSEETFEPETETEVEPEVEPSEPVVNGNGVPQQSRGAIEEEIDAVVRGYHLALVEGRFQRAWQLLSARKRQQTLAESTYPKWRAAQATLVPYLEPLGARTRVVAFEGDGVARVDVTGMGWSAPASPCSEWSGLTWAKYEGGSWHYDPGYSTTPARERAWKAPSRYAKLMGTTC
jgi:Double-GTPase 2